MFRTWIAATALSLVAGLAHAETEIVVQYPYPELFEGTHKRIIDIKEPNARTVEALNRLVVPAGVFVKIKA